MNDQEKEDMFYRNEIYIYWYIKKINLKHMTDELYGAGLIGLVKAINTYKPEMPNKENTYFIKCIINSINRYLTLQNMPKRKRPKNIISLDEPVLGLNNGYFGDVIPDTRVNVESEAERNIIIEKIRNILNELSYKDKKIIIDYYGFNGEKKTEMEIAKELKVSKQNISFRKSRILKDIRKKLEGGKIWIMILLLAMFY